MAINPSTNTTMTGRVTAADLDYPYASSKDETTPGAGDGTPYFKARADDIFGLQQALLRAGGIVPTGTADTARASQYMQAMIELISGRGLTYDDSGAADAYQLDAQSNQQLPASLFDGLVVTFAASNTNTGACTAQLGALGTVDIKLRGGSADPAAGDVRTGHENRMVYRSTPSAHWELDRSGRVVTTVVTATDATWAPQPDTETIEFDVVGGGGGAGGVDGQGAGTAAITTGGGGGGREWDTSTVVDATYNITVGAGGAGGAAGNNVGTNGGASSVVSTTLNLSATGGDGSFGALGTSGDNIRGGAKAGIGSGGRLNAPGRPATSSIIVGGSPSAFSVSGAAPGMGGGRVLALNSAGTAAVAYGEGGGGASVVDAATNYAGGDGYQGVVVVREHL